MMFSSKKQDWATPPEFLEFMKERFDWTPDLDAACSPHNVKARMGFCLENGRDGLKETWFGNVWVNPPFGRELPKWIKKAITEVNRFDDPAKSVMMLIPARTDTKWFHELVAPFALRIWLIKGRFNYLEDGTSKASNAPFPTMLVHFNGTRDYLGNNIQTLDVPSISRGMKR